MVSPARQELAQQIKAAVRSQRRTPKMYRWAKRHAFMDIPLVPIVPLPGPEKVEIDTSFTVTVRWTFVGLLVGCLTSQQHASVSQGRICSDKLTSCHTEIEVADQTFHLTQSQYTDTGPTGPSTDPIKPGRVTTGVSIFKALVRLDPGKISVQARFEPGIFHSRGVRPNH